MRTKSVLIVEDESIIAHSIAKKVESFGYVVATICSEGKTAISYVHENNIALILMDINIKGSLDGIETAEKISQEKTIPIIYITAYMDEKTIERAIKTNPSAYLTKPIKTSELLASLKIALKNNVSTPLKGNFVFDEAFSFDTTNNQLFNKGEFVKLSKRETQLLSLFVRCKNQIITIDTIECEIWPDKEPNENTRRALIGHLRTKINYNFIETISGIGYRLNVNKGS